MDFWIKSRKVTKSEVVLKISLHHSFHIVVDLVLTLLPIESFQLEYPVTSFIHFVVLYIEPHLLQDHLDGIFVEDIRGDAEVEASRR